MHPTAYGLGTLFLQFHGRAGQRILEVGSANETGGLRELCPEGATWIGVDQRPGAGVDVVSSSHALPFEDESFDLVVSSSCLEHDPMFWITFLEVARVLRQGALAYLNVPAKGPYHAFPVDCWRFYPDAGEALAQWARRSGREMKMLEAFSATVEGQPWVDLALVYCKGDFVGDYAALQAQTRRTQMVMT